MNKKSLDSKEAHGTVRTTSQRIKGHLENKYLPKFSKNQCCSIIAKHLKNLEIGTFPIENTLPDVRESLLTTSEKENQINLPVNRYSRKEYCQCWLDNNRSKNSFLQSESLLRKDLLSTQVKINKLRIRSMSFTSNILSDDKKTDENINCSIDSKNSRNQNFTGNTFKNRSFRKIKKDNYSIKSSNIIKSHLQKSPPLQQKNTENLKLADKNTMMEPSLNYNKFMALSLQNCNLKKKLVKSQNRKMSLPTFEQNMNNLMGYTYSDNDIEKYEHIQSGKKSILKIKGNSFNEYINVCKLESKNLSPNMLLRKNLKNETSSIKSEKQISNRLSRLYSQASSTLRSLRNKNVQIQSPNKKSFKLQIPRSFRRLKTRYFSSKDSSKKNEKLSINLSTQNISDKVYGNTNKPQKAQTLNGILYLM